MNISGGQTVRLHSQKPDEMCIILDYDMSHQFYFGLITKHLCFVFLVAVQGFEPRTRGL